MVEWVKRMKAIAEKHQQQPVAMAVNKTMWDALEKLPTAPRKDGLISHPLNFPMYGGIEVYLKDGQVESHRMFYNRRELLDYLKNNTMEDHNNGQNTDTN